jgi:hypothetical protein
MMCSYGDPDLASSLVHVTSIVDCSVADAVGLRSKSKHERNDIRLHEATLNC